MKTKLIKMIINFIKTSVKWLAEVGGFESHLFRTKYQNSAFQLHSRFISCVWLNNSMLDHISVAKS